MRVDVKELYADDFSEGGSRSSLIVANTGQPVNRINVFLNYWARSTARLPLGIVSSKAKATKVFKGNEKNTFLVNRFSDIALLYGLWDIAYQVMPVELPKIVLSERPPPAQQIAYQILEHLVSGKVKPGDRLPSERQLAEKLRVSRSTIRDALKSLGMLGLIRAKPGGGSYFQDVPSSLLPRSVEWGLLIGERHTLDLVEARGIIEVGVARLAAQRIDKEGVDRLQDALAKMKSAQEDPKRFVEADLEFHFRLADASRNSSLYEILSGMRTLLDVWIRRVVYAAAENGDLRPRYRRHVAIFDAVKKGDLDAAARAMEEHMASASASLKATLEQHRETKR